MAAPPITINADEVNCLIYAYLKDSGDYTSFFALCAVDTYLQASSIPPSVCSMKVISNTLFTWKNKFLGENS
jgi:hypothetical protein